MTRLVAEALDLYLSQPATFEPITADDRWVLTERGRDSLPRQQQAA
ncbi:MAG: hypothetical protein ACHQ7M_17830 [Chloroflexota bacterium]